VQGGVGLTGLVLADLSAAAAVPLADVLSHLVRRTYSE
jgi:hypothetical protein